MSDMSDLLIVNARVAAAEQLIARGWLAAEQGRIHAIGSGNPPHHLEQAARILDAGGMTVLPGFVDVHVHGAVGYDTMDGDADGLREMARFYATHGVTAFLPTTWTAPTEPTLAALEAVAEAHGTVAGGARILGAHMEGPYLCQERAGAQDPATIRTADPAEARAFLDTEIVRLITLAPEIPANRWLIEECVARGITVSAGHTAATYEQMAAAAGLGVRHTTHLYNAMSGLHHRAPGAVGAALTIPQLRCELIADTIHVHPAAMAVAYQAKGVHGIVLISDAVRVTGLWEVSGESFDLDGRIVRVTDGGARLPDGTLAGSVLTLDVAIRNLSAATGQPVEALWPAASLNAAEAAGVASQTGSLSIGKHADLVVLDAHGQVAVTVVGGAVVYQNPEIAPQIITCEARRPDTQPNDEVHET
jgi:N-acetylglucosamine-6-phosphate deacetylase